MFSILQNDSSARLSTNRRGRRSRSTSVPGMRSPEKVKEMLRDIAFVLKMTQRVREEMERPEGADEFVRVR